MTDDAGLGPAGPARVTKPIIFIGAPRSGTTVIFNVFAARPDLAWFSSHLDRFPRWPSVTVLARLADLGRGFRKSVVRSDRSRRRLEKLRVGPAEAYGVWEHYSGRKFLFDFMRDAEASEEEQRRLQALVAKVLRYQGKERFATKITGPARISYLSSVFPDAVFVHVVRDGRAVVNSLLDVQFWKGTWREREESWRGALTADELARWRELGESPAALAALQWRAIVLEAREEAARLAPEQYAELRYEDFVADGDAALDELAHFCGLPPSPETHEFLSRRVELRDMNDRWRERFDEREIALIDDLAGDALVEFGYVDGPEPSSTAAPRRLAVARRAG